MLAADETLLRKGVVLAQWIRLLLEGASKAGLQHVVISPGSRNTPLIFAFARDERFVCHQVLDERCAGFFALGLARELEAPVGLCCTSGSAGAHYLPAVIEAHMSSVPLVVLTSDRPRELMGCGAAQTIDQERLFGGFAKALPPLSEPSDDEDKMRAFLHQAQRAVNAALSFPPGPVHLNLPFAKPLEMRSPASAEDHALVVRTDRLLARGPSETLVCGSPDPTWAGTIDALFCAELEWVVTLGACTPAEARLARRLADRRGVPLLSEFAQAGPASPLHFLCNTWIDDPSSSPTGVLHVGAPPVSPLFEKWLRVAEPELWVAGGPRLRDPGSHARRTLLGPLGEVLSVLLAAAERASYSSRDERPEWKSASAAHLTRMRALLTADQQVSDVRATFEVLQALDESHAIVLGNSLPIRNAALVSPLLDSARHFITTRGANGIDGTIASASGACLALGHPTVALIGDVTAAHDLSSLAIARSSKHPLVVCILDNGGGRIFDQLPAAQLYAEDESLWRFWTTPPGLDWEAAARAYGVAFCKATTSAQIAPLLFEALKRGGTTLMVVATSGKTEAFRAELEGGRA